MVLRSKSLIELKYMGLLGAVPPCTISSMALVLSLSFTAVAVEASLLLVNALEMPKK